MSKTQNIFSNPTMTQKVAPKVNNDDKIKSNSKVRIERNIEN